MGLHRHAVRLRFSPEGAGEGSRVFILRLVLVGLPEVGGDDVVPVAVAEGKGEDQARDTADMAHD